MKHSAYNNRNESTGFLFWQLSTLWQRKIKEVLTPFSLTHTQYVILAVIEDLQETVDNINQKLISDISNIDVMTISSTLRLLERKKLIVRKKSRTDTRAYTIMNSKIGSNVLIKSIKEVEGVDKIFFTQDTKIFNSKLKELIKKNKLELK